MSRWKIEPNPYLELDLDQLERACSDLLKRLAAPGPHSRESKQQLAKDLRFFLIIASMRLSPGHYTPGEPENWLMMGSQTTVEGAFGLMYRAKAARLRNQTLERAASLVLGDKFEGYLRAGMPGEKPREIAWNSEDGLMDELRKLDDVNPRKNQKQRQ